MQFFEKTKHLSNLKCGSFQKNKLFLTEHMFYKKNTCVTLQILLDYDSFCDDSLMIYICLVATGVCKQASIQYYPSSAFLTELIFVPSPFLLQPAASLKSHSQWAGDHQRWYGMCSRTAARRGNQWKLPPCTNGRLLLLTQGIGDPT